eukprot:Seg1909.4 transcript_id=Seg1909.4/GoldUCD/mRNA.D3Y31 product="Low density lipoprotein receptor adapter protein 1-B" protein_id=Seg1909.4/GoldUCD/D3Y31
MESLREAALALRKSPQAVRKKLNKITGKFDRKKLVQSVDDEITFLVKHLGTAILTKEHGTAMTDDVVRKLLEDAKQVRASTGNKLPKSLLTIAPDQVMLEDADTKELLFTVPIASVSYWRVDPQLTKVFSFTEDGNNQKDTSCHAFVTAKTSLAEEAVKAISEAAKAAEDCKQANIIRRRSAVEEKCDKEAEALYTNMNKSASNSSTNLSPRACTFDPSPLNSDSETTSINDEKVWKRFDESDDFSSDDDSTNNIGFIYDNLGSTATENTVEAVVVEDEFGNAQAVKYSENENHSNKQIIDESNGTSEMVKDTTTSSAPQNLIEFD